MCFIKIVIEICFPAGPKMPFGGHISLTYLRNIYEWELGSGMGGGGGGGGAERIYFYSNFFQTHSILHFKLQ